MRLSNPLHDQLTPSGDSRAADVKGGDPKGPNSTTGGARAPGTDEGRQTGMPKPRSYIYWPSEWPQD